MWIGVWAITGVETTRHRRVEEALRQSYLSATAQMADVYERVMALVGFRPRPGLTVRQFAIAVAALTEGCVLRNRVDTEEMKGIWRTSEPGGEAREWTLFGLALDALTREFFEPDPHWVPPGQGATLTSASTERER